MEEGGGRAVEADDILSGRSHGRPGKGKTVSIDDPMDVRGSEFAPSVAGSADEPSTSASTSSNRSLKRNRIKSVLDRHSTLNNMVEPMVVEGHNRVNESNIPFVALYTGYILVMGLIVAAVLQALGECRPKQSNEPSKQFFECFFVAINALTGSGLQLSHSISKFTGAGKWVILLTMQLGSSTIATLTPIIIRIHYLRKAQLSNSELTFNLKRFRRVPQSLVEYKALKMLVKIVFLYHVVVYLFYSMCMTIWVYSNDRHREHIREVLKGTSRESSVGTFIAFTTVSTFTNTGFTVTDDSMIKFRHDFFFLFCCNMLAIHGNVLFPVFLRWIIVFMNSRSKKSSSRKVYFRYLLTKGRDLYCNLFTSQQTWLLLIIQIVAIVLQAVLTLLTSYNELPKAHTTDGSNFEMKFNAAFFCAVNTRHAGLQVVDLRHLSAAANIMFIFFMFLAPSPLAAVQKSSEEQAQLELHLAHFHLNENEGNDGNDGKGTALRSTRISLLQNRTEELYLHSGRLLNIALAQSLNSPTSQENEEED